MTVNVSWRRSGRDGQVHAFPQVAEPRSFLVALCSHSTRPAALGPLLGIAATGARCSTRAPACRAWSSVSDLLAYAGRQPST